MDSKDFGPRLRKIRRFRRITQQDISKQLNISRQAYSNYEQGRCMPPPDILADISILLQTNLFLLFIHDSLSHFCLTEIQSDTQEIPDAELQTLVCIYSKMEHIKRQRVLDYILSQAPESEVKHEQT